MTLYHGSPDPKLTEIHSGGIFGGLFMSSDERTARSHGAYLYTCELDDNAICTQQELDYHADPDKIVAVLEAEGATWETVIDGEQADDAEADWDAQRVRGLVAAALGFRAVECSDEHGTSYLVLPGVTLTRTR